VCAGANVQHTVAAAAGRSIEIAAGYIRYLLEYQILPRKLSDSALQLICCAV
jgi:hypothetical protein